MKRIVQLLSSAALLTQLVYCAGSDPSSSVTPDPGAGAEAGTTKPTGDASTPSGDASTPTDGSVVNPAGNDPAKDGPYAITEIDATTQASLTSDTVSLHVAYPTAGPTAGPYPVVILAHGFTLSPTFYAGYIKHLATFGYVAMTANYNDTTKSNVRDADNLRGALDWALAATELAGKVDAAKAGVMGHSRGGKAAVIAASRDARFKAVLGLDPVDGSKLSCDPIKDCPDASNAMASLTIPSAFLGETTDATSSSLQACAPAADNYTTFYGSAPAKSVEITLLGANHLTFLDDPTACVLCTFLACNTETGAHADLIDLAHAMTVSFFERNLRGDTAQDAYLTGAQAQSRYVTPGLATIRSK
jgi:pimeloyl-ACP methyl ester carboxylesterase